jgi:spore coat polysaccharide biosynthesis predicted glycosyltransferase SpsG/RimJ/RimL family protein N-acetyltransferase
MKVKIFTEGGKSIGYGHLSRCIALYDEIQNRSIEVELIIYGDVGNIGLLKGKVFRNEDWINIEYLEKTLSSEDYVIVDSYKADIEHYEKIALKSKRALYIDDNGRIEYPRGIIVNPAIDSSHIDYSYMPEERVLKGSKYVILRPAFRYIENKKLQENVRRIVVIMGGTDIRNITTKIVNNICEVNQNIIFDVVVDDFQFEKLSSINKIENVNYHKDLSEIEMKQIMLSADMAISAAGQTIYELIATQTPFIAIQVAENQQNNIDSLKEQLPSQIVLRYDDENLIEKLQEKILEIKGCEFRKKISEGMKNIIDGNGSKRIIDALLSERENEGIHLRRVQKQDIKDVFELSNEDYVRRYSINKNKILWEDHVKWFNKVLEDDNIVFYVVTDGSDSFLGQIRFNIDKDNATVSISLSNKLRGRGLSRSLLKQSIKKLFAEENQVNEIIAYVSEINVASMKIFTGLNFKVNDANDSMIKLILRRKDYVN